MKVQAVSFLGACISKTGGGGGGGGGILKARQHQPRIWPGGTALSDHDD